jgi:hypothetical protein
VEHQALGAVDGIPNGTNILGVGMVGVIQRRGILGGQDHAMGGAPLEGGLAVGSQERFGGDGLVGQAAVGPEGLAPVSLRQASGIEAVGCSAKSVAIWLSRWFKR